MPTVEADKLVPGDVLEADDVLWWSHSSKHLHYTVDAIFHAEDGKLIIRCSPETGFTRQLRVPANRRFTTVVEE
jgi:hypothetical protein